MGLETQPPGDPRPVTHAAAPLPVERLSTAEASAAVEPVPQLPDFAKKAYDLEAIKQAVDDAASVGGGLWLSYLIVLFYLAIAAGAVSHEDLFFEKPIKLPFLIVELPLLAFCFLAPILFVIVHAYALVHLVLLTDKAKHYHQALHYQISDDTKLPQNIQEENAAVRTGLRRQLPSNIFIQFLAGPADLRESFFGWLLQGIAWITLAVGPILLLLLIQVRFLPLHRLSVTWAQRIALGVDLILLWWLWRKVLSGRWNDNREYRRHWAWPTSGLAIVGATFLFSVAVVTFPSEWQEEWLPSWRIFPVMAEWGKPATETDANGNVRTASIRDWMLNAERASLHDWLFNATPDEVTRHRLPFSSTLVLPGLNVYEALGIDDPDKAKWHDFVFRARGRDLKGAIFDLASLPKIDFEGADLTGASLVDAQLQGASFVDAQLQGASLVRAQLQSASLVDAQLQRASLVDAQLQSASLDHAQLQGASLVGAQLQGASLYDAKLQGASLVEAQLQGALLDGAQLQGASLEGADLEGASLEHAQLQGAPLSYVRLQGASLDGAQLQGASLAGAQLQGASLSLTTMEATDLSGTRLWRTNAQPQPSRIAAIQMAGVETWLPEWIDQNGKRGPWDAETYQALRTSVESLSTGENHASSLERIQRLDCSNRDSTLASCNPSLPLPPEAEAWRKALQEARVDDQAYASALAETLKKLVCSGDADSIYVVRGAGFRTRLLATRHAAPDLIDDLMDKESKDCSVAAAMTDTGRAYMLRIKQAVLSAEAPQKLVTSEMPYSP